MQITDKMIQAALGAPTLGDEHSYICDYISTPEQTDAAEWKVIGGYYPGSEIDWQWHIIRRILEAALSA